MERNALRAGLVEGAEDWRALETQGHAMRANVGSCERRNLR